MKIKVTYASLKVSTRIRLKEKIDHLPQSYLNQSPMGPLKTSSKAGDKPVKALELNGTHQFPPLSDRKSGILVLIALANKSPFWATI